MTKKSKKLRHAAEAGLQAGSVKTEVLYADLPSLVHELQVHQIELEMQNEELREAKLELEASRDSYAELFDFAPVGYLTLSGTGLTEQINLHGAVLLGEERSKLLERPFDHLIAPEDRDRWRRQYDRVSRQGITVDIDLALQRVDGSHFQAHLRCTHMETKPRKMRIVFTDISTRKHTEAELKHHREHLEKMVGARTHELAEANVRLTELDRLKSLFIASMSHELRTPLNSILGFTDLILDGHSGEISVSQRDQLQRVHGAGRHLLGLISDIIDLSKLEAGMTAATPKDFELEALMDEAVEANVIAAGKQGLSLLLEPPGQEIAMHSDRRRLMQCLLNLISNAVKYSKAGTIRLSAQLQGDEVILEVHDSGIGLSEDQVALLFQPFARIDSELSVEAGGTGLGLYLTKKLVTELLGGSISVESRPGVGSCFSLRLPRSIRDL